MSPAPTPLPIGAGLFLVEIDGIQAAAFSSCRGLGGSAGFLAVREGGADEPRWFPEGRSWEPLRLERGCASGSDLWDWFISGAPREGAVTLLEPSGRAAGRWAFTRGRATRWQGPALEASGSRLALEAVEIVHEGLRWEMP
jgi:phage tail-like protein